MSFFLEIKDKRRSEKSAHLTILLEEEKNLEEGRKSVLRDVLKRCAILKFIAKPCIE